MKLTAEQVKLAQSCKTPEELMAKAHDTGMALSLEQAQAALDSVEMVELNADDLDVVSGGCWTGYTCYFCGQDFDTKPPHQICIQGSPTATTNRGVCESCYQQKKNEYHYMS